MFDFKLDDDVAIQYLTESREQLAIVEANLLAFETEGAKIDEERVNRSLLAMHKIKAGAEIFDLAKIGGLARQAENALVVLRSWKAARPLDLIRILLRATVRLNELIENSETSNEADTSQLTAELASLADNWTPTAKSGAAGANHAHRARGPLRVLLVDDDFSCRLLLQSFLSRYGECHVAVNGSEAVHAFEAALDQGQGYDLVCMDILMPRLDGREAVSQIRAFERGQGILPEHGAKVFMTTTVAEVRHVIHSFQALCDAYLMKPVDLGQLLKQMKLYELLP
jgi:two-component system chemotaxis response regulator CheY